MTSLGPAAVHVFRTRSGETIRVPWSRARRTMDKRAPGLDPEVVWEITQDSGLILRLWPEDVLSWQAEEVS